MDSSVNRESISAGDSVGPFRRYNPNSPKENRSWLLEGLSEQRCQHEGCTKHFSRGQSSCPCGPHDRGKPAPRELIRTPRRPFKTADSTFRPFQLDGGSTRGQPSRSLRRFVSSRLPCSFLPPPGVFFPFETGRRAGGQSNRSGSGTVASGRVAGLKPESVAATARRSPHGAPVRPIAPRHAPVAQLAKKRSSSKTSPLRSRW